jgi:hypothetical protein
MPSNIPTRLLFFYADRRSKVMQRTNSQAIGNRQEATPIAGKPQSIELQTFLTLVALYLVALYPVIRAGRSYEDDLKRALMGLTGWDSNGRFLTTFIMRVSQFYDHAMVDISPLTQFAAIGILAWAGVQLARRYSIESPWMAALVTFPLGAQPFFMANLSFKFDSLPMALAILMVLQPIVSRGNSRRDWWLGILGIFGGLNLYQPAINVLLVFALVDLVMSMLERRTPGEVRAQAWARATQIGVAMLAYQLIVGVHISSWVKQHSGMISNLRDLDLIPRNFLAFYGFIADSFNVQWWMYFGPVLVVLAMVPVVVGIRYSLLCWPRSAGARWGVITFSLLVPLIAASLAIGPMLLFENPLVLARVLNGVGGLLAGALIIMQAAFRCWGLSPNWSFATALMFAVGMCVFSSAYGNAAEEQKYYEQRIGTELSDDIASARASRPINAYIIDGTDGFSALTAHVASQLPLVGRLVQPYLSASDVFFAHYFLLSYIPDIVDMRHLPGGGDRLQEARIVMKSCNVRPLRVSSVYSLYLVDETAVISFAGAHKQRCSANRLQSQP